jgi:hypothetical protein
LTGAVKWYRLTNGENHVFVIGNFDINERTTNFSFPKTGKWYGFFTRDSIEINTTNQNILLAPGEYRLYSTRKFKVPDVITENDVEIQKTGDIRIYPNPANSEINISSEKLITGIQIYTVTGKLMSQKTEVYKNQTKINIVEFTPGIYVVQVFREDGIKTLKFVVR